MTCPHPPLQFVTFRLLLKIASKCRKLGFQNFYVPAMPKMASAFVTSIAQDGLAIHTLLHIPHPTNKFLIRFRRIPKLILKIVALFLCNTLVFCLWETVINVTSMFCMILYHLTFAAVSMNEVQSSEEVCATTQPDISPSSEAERKESVSWFNYDLNSFLISCFGGTIRACMYYHNWWNDFCLRKFS